MEIERKYLLKTIPETLDTYTHYDIEQAYLANKPVVRVRKRVSPDNKEFFLTVKSTGMIKREEVETAISEDTYNTFLEEAEGNIITKTRYIIPLDDVLKVELDVFNGVFEGIIMAEVEFPDEKAAKKFTPPDYFSDEVTFDKRFHNSNMSTMSEVEISELVDLAHTANIS
ncbi:MAG: CYTH domain-containing protein [Lachnospiraceae bacterium]|nr:CYTH domain-containing protein [Lachnospiraceae bacterium]